MNNYRTSLLISLWATLFAIVTASGVGCSTNPATGEKEFIFISESQEIAMGTEAAPKFEDEFGGKVPSSRVQSYVRDLGIKLSAVSDRPELPWDFTVVNSSTPNAFALPGGKIFVTAGLFKSFTNERQLSAVLAHEISHVCAKHNVKGMQRQMGVAAAAEVAASVASGESAESAKAVTQIVGNMALLKYSREDEYQADSLGIDYMERGGYNPWGMVETLELLQELGGAEGGKFEEMFRTHPLTSERINEAREKVEDKYPTYSPAAGDPHAERFRNIRNLIS